VLKSKVRDALFGVLAVVVLVPFLIYRFWLVVTRKELWVDQETATTIVRAWLERNSGWHYFSLDLAERLRLPLGQVHIALIRLERAGLLQTSWESVGDESRRPRRGYRWPR
jgi:hypothetical protein